MIDTTLERFQSYEQYLDDHMSDEDLFYLEDKELARQLIEVGYHGKGEILTREQFAKRIDAIAQAKKNKNANQPKALSHAGCKIAHSPFLTALAEREELVRNGRMTTIIFIRDQKKGKNEISGYIDLAHRLKTDDFKLIFEGKKTLLPKPSDLSYYNWDA